MYVSTVCESKEIRRTNLDGEEFCKNVGEDTTLRDDDGTQETVKLFVVSDGELEMTGYDTGFLVVTGCVTGQLEDFSGEV